MANSVVVTAWEMADLVAVCFVRGKRPERQTIELAKEKGLPLLRTELPLFESSGRLYECGIAGCFEGSDRRRHGA
jgi:hypothetical protein